jgi:hypothetical protein
MADLALDSITKSYLDCWLEDCKDSLPSTSNQSALSMPYQRWFKFKEAFAPSFVVETIQRLPKKPVRCLDPFGGSGTTALTCQFLGVESATIEANPFLADLIESKVHRYDVNELRHSCQTVSRLAKRNIVVNNLADCFPGAPPTFMQPGDGERWIFNHEVARAIVALRSEINRIANTNHRRFLRVMLGSKLVEVSNVIVNGKGRRYRRRWSERSTDAADVFLAFDESCRTGLRDLEGFSQRTQVKARVLRGDARKLVKTVGSVDFVLTSPPYPNSFDYTDIYNLELWALGYLKSGRDNRNLREKTIRSHVQIAHEESLSDSLPPTLRSIYRALVRRRTSLWNRRIPEMVCHYFEDIGKVLTDCRTVLSEEGVIVMAVGNSRYGGILIDVPKILSDMVGDLGFQVITRESVRSMRSSAQQGGRRVLNESLIWLRHK